MPDVSLEIRSRRVVTPEGVLDAVVTVDHGRIEAVTPAGHARSAPHTLDVGDLVLLPGLVDTHVHVNEPGRTEWEGWATASAAALAGGITTIVDMPLNSIPATVNVAALEEKARAAAASSRVDYGFWGGVVPGNGSELEPLARAGVLGFKCFLAPSGVPEFAHVGERDLREAMPILARLRLPLLTHAEDPAALEEAGGAVALRPGDRVPAPDPRRYATWLASRPREAERRAIRMLIALAAETGCATHIVHLADAGALADLRAARARGVPITVETCPHYLTFAAEEIADGATHFKCAPPIREAENRERLWAALAAGDIDLVATDHSPCPPALRQLERGDFMAAWGGITSLEAALAAVWTGARVHGHGPEAIARWMSAAPARLAGLGARKGAIAPGHDADLVVWDPDESWLVEPTKLRQRHPVTPYAGRTLHGRVREVFVRGRRVFDAERGLMGEPAEARLMRSG